MRLSTCMIMHFPKLTGLSSERMGNVIQRGNAASWNVASHMHYTSIVVKLNPQAWFFSSWLDHTGHVGTHLAPVSRISELRVAWSDVS